MNLDLPLRLVGHKFPEPSGIPNDRADADHCQWLGEYFLSVDSTVEEITPLVNKIAVDNQVVVTVVNAGKFELLVSFACAAMSRGLSVEHMLVLITDPHLKDLVEDLGKVSQRPRESWFCMKTMVQAGQDSF